MDPTTYPEAVAAVVRSHMAQAGLTSRELADTASIPHTTLLRRLKPDAFGFNTRELAAVATALGTTPAAIYTEAQAAA